MHWADVLAERLLKKSNKHVLATGITPSGPIHIGNMREILTSDAVYRCLIDKGGDAELIYVADDFDPLRRVYPYLPSTYEKYVGMPIYDIPCPCGKHKSYADHYLTSFLNALKEIGVKSKVYRASEMYNKGKYNEAIQIALENTEKIKEIIQSISKRQLPKEWIPFNIRCENCKRLTTTKAVLYEHPIIEYKCECGFEGEVDITKGGVGKLPWRVDWPARWKMLKVTFEPLGKDLGTAGGARDTGKKIVEEVYNYPAPEYVIYEFIMLKGKGAMHSSKGTALSAEEMLKMTPAEVLRFLIINNQPNKHIVFDSGLGILNLVDEYDKEERAYFGKEEATKGMKDLKKTYELSQPYFIPKKMPFQIPYRHLVTLVQIGKNWEEIKKILIRTNQIPKDLEKTDEEHLKQRVENVKYWLKNFAPDVVKFEVKKKLPKIAFSDIEKTFLSNLEERLSKIRWEAENIHKAIYEQAEKQNMQVNDAFKIIYKVILNQEKGPRAGYFLSNLDKDFVLSRFKEAVK
ncbi:MAG: lysine--tRNA ligase [Candidatus Thermoplasmatota archaeon]|jgi:lysyl-tRNA synthetase class 1|nr:lysine--tRNA ligase [Candidatus Thermoplasmatota archaeon]